MKTRKIGKEIHMPKKVISTDKAPQAIGPYSQAIQVDKQLFVSGQIAIDPATGEVQLGDIESQTHRVMQNLSAILEAAGGSLDSVAKCTIFLKDLGNFTAVNEIYGSYFNEEPPARATVEVSELPKGVDVEIDAVAFLE